MKKIINGRRYDTDTAKELAKAYAPCAVNDFNYWEETLYRKNTGEYFLHGVGNANSRYAERTAGGWCGGSKLIPLTIEAAQEWAEQNLDGDEYEQIFGAIEESSEKRAVTFSLSKAMIEKIARLAAEKGISKSDVIAHLLT